MDERWDGPLELIHVEMLSSALEACRRGGFDVLLLDLSLPDSQGLETFLKLSAQAGEIPIVVITGLDDERTAIKAVQAGCRTISSRDRSTTTCWSARSATPSSGAAATAPSGSCG